MARRDTYLGGAARATIAAPPESLWPIVADPTRHPALAGSGEPRSIHLVTEGPVRLGTEFEARQNLRGVRYTVRSRVTACDPPRLFRWTPFGVAAYPPGVVDLAWEFRLASVDGGTRVEHAYHWGLHLPVALAMVLMPFRRWRARENVDHMVRTLENLARLAGAPPPTEVQVRYETRLLEPTAGAKPRVQRGQLRGRVKPRP